MEETDDELRTGSSAKIDQLVTLLRLTPDSDKSLVFSQFTSFLDKVSLTAATHAHRLKHPPSRSPRPWTRKGEWVVYRTLTVA